MGWLSGEPWHGACFCGKQHDGWQVSLLMGVKVSIRDNCTHAWALLYHAGRGCRRGQSCVLNCWFTFTLVSNPMLHTYVAPFGRLVQATTMVWMQIETNYASPHKTAGLMRANLVRFVSSIVWSSPMVAWTTEEALKLIELWPAKDICTNTARMLKT